MPESQPLALLRRDIDGNPDRLKAVLTDPAIRKLVLNGTPKDEKKAIKAFTDQNKENMLKTKPKVRIPCVNCRRIWPASSAWRPPLCPSVAPTLSAANSGLRHLEWTLHGLKVKNICKTSMKKHKSVKVQIADHEVDIRTRGGRSYSLELGEPLKNHCDGSSL